MMDNYYDDLRDSIAEHQDHVSHEELRELTSYFMLLTPQQKSSRKHDLQQLQEKVVRDQLTGGGGPDEGGPRGKGGVEALSTLNKAYQELLISEGVAQATLENLQVQRGQLEKSQDNLKTVNDGIKDSNVVLNRMGKWWRR